MTAFTGHTEAKAVAEIWFGIEAHADRIIRFREQHIDNFAVGDIWLVRSRDRDLAVDTGSGIVAPAPLIEAVADRPVMALALNCYYDHAGGWHSFPERACHPLDAAPLTDPTTSGETIRPYLHERTLWALPQPDFDLSDYKMTPATATRLVDEGDTFDLGNRVLTVLHVPGPSEGGLALFEEATGSLFTSDALYDGAHGDAWPPDIPDAYVASLRRMRELPVRCVYAGHYGTLKRTRMLEVIDAQLRDLGG